MPEGTRPARPVVVRCVFCGKANRVDLTRLSAGPKCAECARPILLDRPLKVSEADFEQTLRGSSAPVLVDFYADWCGPCKMMAPTLDDFTRQHAGELLVLKLDTDANPAVTTRFGIRGIPTIIAFQDGLERGRHVGAADLRALEGLIGRA
jgi:thioredoxin 2